LIGACILLNVWWVWVLNILQSRSSIESPA
jgi:hypothetical protein